MIESYKEMKEYYNADLLMSGLNKRNLLSQIVDRRYRFYRSLRKT